MLKILCFIAILTAPAAAFTQEDVLHAELLPGWRGADGRHMAALSLTLAQGWKTYWRSPGDSGIPPLLDFAGSGNLSAVHLHWPSPVMFDVNGSQTIGYLDRLVLPIELTPTQAAQPIEIRLNVDLGVCRDICVPAHVEMSASLPAQSRPDPVIEMALASVPGSAIAAGLTGIDCTVAPIADGLAVTTRIAMPSLGQGEAIIIEPADNAIWVSQSDTRRDGEILTATTDLVPPGGGPFALDRSTLRVTVISDLGAVEVTGCPAP